MSRARLVVVALTTALLAALVGWQIRRERLVRACLEAGGEWHGPRSLCLDPIRPILQRDELRRGDVSPQDTARNSAGPIRRG
jgi:hypothetical protein